MNTPAPPPAYLARIARQFPGFRIWQSLTWDGPRYTAQATSLDTHPHAVVTADLAELADALTPRQQA